ncbi:MAG TPA: Calx-beta domain-containing protein, partial [Methylomirabilota bacterium]|nr:Calx-beta domain-containing protein [Methylomirabilota bacterium]
MTKSALGRRRRPDGAAHWLVLALVVGMGVIRLPAAQVITGQPGVPEVRSVLNLRGAAEMERLHGTSNTTRRAIHAPMPLDRRSTNGPGGGGGGGGLQAASALPSGGDLRPAGTGLPPSPLPSVSFQALPDNNVVIPPDTHGAVGPNHVFTVLNSQVRVQDRSGNVLETMDLGTFWQGLGVADVFDPKALYDPYGGRWIFTAMAERLSDRSSVLLAVSQTEDPTGNWFRYRVDADAQNLAWADYPSLGFNKDWIVVSVNMFPIVDDGGIGYTGVNLYAFNKTNLYANGTGAFTLLRDNSLGGFTMVPAITMDPTYPVMHLVEVENLVLNYTTTSRRLRLSTITGPVGAEVLTLGTGYTTDTNVWASAAPFDPFLGGFGQQLGSAFLIDHNDSRVQNVVYRNGSLWAVHHVHLPANLPTRTSVLWWQMATNGVSTQIGLIDDPGGTNSYAFPSIAVNRNDDVLIGFSRFSPFQYPSANYAFRACSDPPNCFRGDVVLKDGEGEYYKTFLGFANRWGDYSSTVVDPLNDLDFWTIQEYAALPVLSDFIGFQGRWGTWWGKVEPAESCTKVEFKFAQYVVEEDSPGFASISVINIGGAAGTVDFATSDGTALAGEDYLARTGTIVFEAGQLETNFLVVILDNAVVNTNKTFNLSLFNASGPAELGRITNAVVVINDDETSEIVTEAGEFNFSSYLNNGIFYLATEYETSIAPAAREPYTITGRDRTAPGVLVTVVRTNGARGRVLVDYATAPGGTAIPFSDYLPVQGTMVFDDYQTSTNFLVQVFPDSSLLSTGTRFIRLVLSNPRPAPEEEAARPGTVRPRLGLGSESGILVYSLGTATNFFDAYSFERRNWRADEYASDNQVGGYRVFYVQVVGPQGQVRLTTREHPDGGGWGRWVLSRTFLNAGADFAEAEDPGGFLGFNVWPNPTYTDASLSTITNFSDYLATNVVLTFTDTIQRRNVLLVVTNDPTVEFNEDIWMVLEQIPNNPPVHSLGRYGSLTILHEDQPAGAVDREWNVYNLSSSDPPFNRTPGANNTVRALVVQPDGSTVLGGDFTHVNAQRRPGIARMQPNGHVDRTFDPGEGVAGGFVAALALYPTNFVLDSGKILVGGGFTAYNGRQRNGIARVLPNGQLDTTFDPGNGANGPVWSIALQSDGRIVVVGSFTEFNDFPRAGIARLNPDGSLDLTFDPGAGADGTVWAVGLSPNGAIGEQIVLGGDFVFFDGEYHAGVVRLNPDGSIDPNFETGGGVLGSVYALAVATNNSVLVAGYFTEIDARRRINLARFRSDGSLDPDFDPGFGTDGPVLALTLQPDGKPLIGGPFTEFNGTRRLGFARLRLNGTLDTSFLDTAYNQFAGLINTFSFEEPKYVAALAVQPDGNIMIGGSFTNIGGHPSIRAPLRNDWTVFTRADKQIRFNIARVIGGVTPGPGNAEFDSPEYYVDENADLVSVQLQRTDGRLGSLVAQAEAADRVATNQLDYVVTNRVNLWREGNQTPPVGGSAAPVSVGQVSPAYFRIPILNDTLQEGDETVDLSFVRPDGSITLGGEFIPLGGALGRASAVLNIADDDVDHGVFNFLSPNYYTVESALRADITIIRTNGASGPATVHFFTRTSTNTPIATANVDYLPAAQTLFFAQGETSKVVRVTLREDNLVEFDENIELVLTNATGGAKLPGGLPNSIATATLTIIDPDFPPGRLSFDAAIFATNETAGLATISVRRSGGNSGSVSIDYATGDGTATTPGDYLGVTGTLEWDDGDSDTKTFTIPLVTDGIVDGAPFETVNLRLLNPRLGMVSNTNLFGFRTNAVLQIQEVDSYGALSFSQPVYQADENGGSATITVVRRGGIAGTVSCNFGIQPYDPLSPGRDYINTNGTLVFLPGEISKSFTITLLDDTESDDNQGLILTLTNPTNAVLGTPGEATLTLVDNESYAIPAGELDPVFRADTQVNGPVLALGLQPDGRLLVAGEFTEVNNIGRRRVARLNTDGTLDPSFDPASGPNDSVRVLTLQPDSKILIGGLFTQYNGTNRGRIARINLDGTVDTTFAVGAAANNPVFAITLQADDKILVGGSFSTFNSVPRAGIVRLNTNGTLDVTFNPGAGANNAVYAVAVQGDGKIVIGGEFTLFNGQSRARIARLNRDGSLDSSFNPSASFDAAVRALLIQPDGKIVVGGSFTNANGTTRNYLARLNADGTLDTGFLASPLEGADGAVYALAQQVDGKIVVAGDFRLFNGVTRRRLTRLNADGSNDPTINFGSGTDSYIAAVLIQPDRKIVIG